MQNAALAAVDIAKEVFEVGVSDRPGRVAARKRLPRDGFLAFFAQLPKATVVMEACGSAHFWARRIEELGHVVVLLPPQYVRPYVMRNKTDRTEVDALLEAFRNEQIRSVPIKTVTQQVIATLHRPTSGQLRRAHAPRVLERPAPAPRQDVQARRCLPALAPHPRGTLGPVARQEHEAPRPPPLLALRLERKVGHNKAAAALANKLARITWAVWKNDRDFEPAPEPQAA